MRPDVDEFDGDEAKNNLTTYTIGFHTSQSLLRETAKKGGGLYFEADDEDELKKFEKFKGKNDPRILGVSSSGDINKTVINKGIFTSCKKNDTCPPWSIQSDIIKHDKIKKTLNYKNAVLKIYDFPVLYFPKFFHPDPTVKRQSGFLMPTIMSSSGLGTSLNTPYYHVLANNKDFTLNPRFYSKNKLLLQTEFREVGKNSKKLFDFSFLNEKDKPFKSHFFSLQ